MSYPNAETEWTQEQLRQYLIDHGWEPTDFRPGEVIPQGVKFISSEPLTQRDIERAHELLREHSDAFGLFLFRR